MRRSSGSSAMAWCSAASSRSAPARWRHRRRWPARGPVRRRRHAGDGARSRPDGSGRAGRRCHRARSPAGPRHGTRPGRGERAGTSPARSLPPRRGCRASAAPLRTRGADTSSPDPRTPANRRGAAGPAGHRGGHQAHARLDRPATAKFPRRATRGVLRTVRPSRPQPPFYIQRHHRGADEGEVGIGEVEVGAARGRHRVTARRSTVGNAHGFAAIRLPRP